MSAEISLRQKEQAQRTLSNIAIEYADNPNFRIYEFNPEKELADLRAAADHESDGRILKGIRNDISKLSGEIKLKQEIWLGKTEQTISDEDFSMQDESSFESLNEEVTVKAKKPRTSQAEVWAERTTARYQKRLDTHRASIPESGAVLSLPAVAQQTSIFTSINTTTSGTGEVSIPTLEVISSEPIRVKKQRPQREVVGNGFNSLIKTEERIRGDIKTREDRKTEEIRQREGWEQLERVVVEVREARLIALKREAVAIAQRVLNEAKFDLGYDEEEPIEFIQGPYPDNTAPDGKPIISADRISRRKLGLKTRMVMLSQAVGMALLLACSPQQQTENLDIKVPSFSGFSAASSASVMSTDEIASIYGELDPLAIANQVADVLPFISNEALDIYTESIAASIPVSSGLDIANSPVVVALRPNEAQGPRPSSEEQFLRLAQSSRTFQLSAMRFGFTQAEINSLTPADIKCVAAYINIPQCIADLNIGISLEQARQMYGLQVEQLAYSGGELVRVPETYGDWPTNYTAHQVNRNLVHMFIFKNGKMMLASSDCGNGVLPNKIVTPEQPTPVVKATASPTTSPSRTTTPTPTFTNTTTSTASATPVIVITNTSTATALPTPAPLPPETFPPQNHEIRVFKQNDTVVDGSCDWRDTPASVRFFAEIRDSFSGVIRQVSFSTGTDGYATVIWGPNEQLGRIREIDNSRQLKQEEYDQFTNTLMFCDALPIPPSSNLPLPHVPIAHKDLDQNHNFICEPAERLNNTFARVQVQFLDLNGQQIGDIVVTDINNLARGTVVLPDGFPYRVRELNSVDGRTYILNYITSADGDDVGHVGTDDVLELCNTENLPTLTNTATSTASATVLTITNTPTSTPTREATQTPQTLDTVTATATKSATTTSTASETAVIVPTNTRTSTPTREADHTPQTLDTSTPTATKSATRTYTTTSTATVVVPTRTSTPTRGATQTAQTLPSSSPTRGTTQTPQTLSAGHVSGTAVVPLKR